MAGRQSSRQHIKSRVPQAPGQVPSENLVFREFEGINTQAARQAIKPTQFSWIENAMPIGYANIKAVYQRGSALATLTGETPYYSHEYNISGVGYMFYACTSGAAYQVRLSDGAKTTIAAAGTFSSTAVQIAQWKNERILIIDTTSYRDWNGTVLTNLSGGSGAPNNGTCVATFSNRVWIVNGTDNRTISFSNANAYNDFTGSGGSTTLNDETLTSKISQLLAANNFLYVFGFDSINIIADVQVSGGVTLFSNTNISANSGTDLAQTIFAYYRAIWYMNSTGIFALYGATPRKASDDLDGIFQNIDFTKPVTAGSVSIFNILCAAFMFTYNDPLAGARKLIAVYFNKKWFVASQSGSFTIMSSSHGTADAIYAVSGSSVYKLFSDSTTAISQTIQSRFWDFDDFIGIKEALMIGTEGTLPASDGSVTITVDSENGSVQPTASFGGSFAFTWYNSNGVLFDWKNSLGAEFMWLVSGYVWFQSEVSNDGHYLGFTLMSSTASNVFNGFQMQYRKLAAGWGE